MQFLLKKGKYVFIILHDCNDNLFHIQHYLRVISLHQSRFYSFGTIDINFAKFLKYFKT